MAAKTGRVKSRQPVYIQVPQFLIPDPDIRLSRSFPDWREGSPQTQTTCCPALLGNRRTSCRSGEHASSPNSPGQIETLRQEVASSPSRELHNLGLAIVAADALQGESLFSDESVDASSLSDSEDVVVLDSNIVLPSSFEWQPEDNVPLSPCNDDFGVVDVPRFGECLSYSDLWSDVDTFVSVVDCLDEIALSDDRHVPVYSETTIFGLEVIWEVEEQEIVD